MPGEGLLTLGALPSGSLRTRSMAAAGADVPPLTAEYPPAPQANPTGLPLVERRRYCGRCSRVEIAAQKPQPPPLQGTRVTS